jgi:hypothetical protein
LIDILAHVHQQLLCAVKPEHLTTTHQNGSGLDLDLTGQRIRIQEGNASPKKFCLEEQDVLSGG